MHMNKGTKNKTVLLLASLILILTAVVGGTLALLITRTDPVVNTFAAATVDPDVNEDNDNGVKKNVFITNTGTAEAYIRATIIATWQTEKDVNGKPVSVHAIRPIADPDPYDDVAESDYTLKLHTPRDSDEIKGTWLKGSDGFYYWSEPVQPGEHTGILIDECFVNYDTALIPGSEPYYDETDGSVKKQPYYLAVEIVASAVQSDPPGTVMEVWPSVTVDSENSSLEIVQKGGFGS